MVVAWALRSTKTSKVRVQCTSLCKLYYFCTLLSHPFFVSVNLAMVLVPTLKNIDHNYCKIITHLELSWCQNDWFSITPINNPIHLLICFFLCYILWEMDPQSVHKEHRKWCYSDSEWRVRTRTLESWTSTRPCESEGSAANLTCWAVCRTIGISELSGSRLSKCHCIAHHCITLVHPYPSLHFPPATNPLSMLIHDYCVQ